MIEDVRTPDPGAPPAPRRIPPTDGDDQRRRIIPADAPATRWRRRPPPATAVAGAKDGGLSAAAWAADVVAALIGGLVAMGAGLRVARRRAR